jgi:glycosyltransferase involved in cell wall biosynthesis
MKVSGFTIVRNGVKLQYPVIASIMSILPICDEFIVAVGDSNDGTLDLIKSIASPKIKIIQTVWDMSQDYKVLSVETNKALAACSGDWAFYLQTDEVVHEADLPKVKASMEKYLNDQTVDGLRFKWFHFYGSHWRYRIDSGWYQKQVRIIRNNAQVHSYGDAFGFERRDGKPMRVRNTDAFIYHYGWVFSEEVMASRRINQTQIWTGVDREKEKKTGRYEFGDLKRFPVYFGSHPSTMKDLIAKHPISQQDFQSIGRNYWWSPLRWFKLRYKTWKRVKEKIV